MTTCRQFTTIGMNKVMTFKKNGLGYLLWALYAVAVCIGFAGVSYTALNAAIVLDPYIRVGLIILGFATSAGIFFLVRRLLKIFANSDKKSVIARLVEEAVVAFLFLGVGLFLRIYFWESGFEETAYFDTAKVTEAAIPAIAYGAEYAYVLMLRGLFLVLGNHFKAGILLQIVLQMTAAGVWYFAIRKLCGAVAALAALGAWMLYPGFIRESLLYSPRMLYLLLFGIGLLAVSGFLTKEKKQTVWILGVVCGIYIGFLAYLDIAGLCLLLPVLYAMCTGNRRFVQSVLLFAFMLITVFLLLYAGAGQNGLSVERIFHTWITLSLPKQADSFSFKRFAAAFFSDRNRMELWMLTAGTFAGLFGIPAFFIKRKTERQALWVLLSAVFFLLWTVGFQEVGGGYGYLFFVTATAAFGAGIQVMLAAVEPTKTVVEEKQEVLEVKQKPEQEEEKEKEKSPEKPSENPPVKEIHFIENPLPLPKKHERRVLGYGKEITPDLLDFDIQISDSDDYDI